MGLVNTYYSGMFYKGMIIASNKDTTHSKYVVMFSTNAKFTRHCYNAVLAATYQYAVRHCPALQIQLPLSFI